MTSATAPAKVNLVLHVGSARPDGLHELCSLFAAVELCDELAIDMARTAHDEVICAGVAGENICHRALAAFRAASSAELPPLAVRIQKRIPVAAGLGGGSADAAAVLRAANELAGDPLSVADLRAVAASVGADVPSQIEPRHALVTGAGEIVEPVELPPMTLVLLPSREGLDTTSVYAEADRMRATRTGLDPAALRTLAGRPLHDFAGSVENDLEAAAVSLRPGLARAIAAIRDAGALAATVSGSGPTVFGIFEHAVAARAAAERAEGAVVVPIRHNDAARPSASP